MTLSLPLSVAMNYTLYEALNTAEKEGELCTSLQNLASSIRTCQRSRMPFPWDLLESAYSGDIQVSKVVQFEIPLLVPAALGILVALLVVIVTLCYCCCRCCCGRCGARLQFSDIEYQKRCCMYITAVPLVFCITVISFTAFSSYESGIKFRRGPRHIVDILDSSLDDLPAFVTDFGQDMSQLVRTELNRTLDMMHYKVKDLSNILAAPLTDIASPAMSRINDHIQTLQNGIDYITQRSVDTNKTVENITVLSQSFQQVVEDTNSVLLNLIMNCANDNENFCHLLLNPINNDVDFNMSELLDFSEAIDEMTTEINGVNLTEIRNLGNDSVSQLPEVIHNSSRTAVTEVLEELGKIPDTVLPKLDEALEFTNMTRSSLGVDGTIDSLKSMVESFDSLTISLVEKTVLPVVSTYKCFLGCLSLVGLLLGVFCSKRGSYMDSRSTASHIGSKFLLWTVFIAAVPSTLFLLLSSVLLIVGGNLSVICGPLQDLSLIDKLDDGYLDLYSADELTESLDVNVSLKRFIETCKEGGTIYSGLNLVETFNLSSYINVSSFIPELGSDVYNEINETIRDMNVIDTELLDNLTSSFSFDNVSEHSNITHSIKEELTELNLQEWSNNLTDASSLLPTGYYADTYRSLAVNLSDADTNIKIPLLAEVDELGNITNYLQTLGDNLRNSSQSISNELNNLQQFIQNQAVDSIFQRIMENQINIMEKSWKYHGILLKKAIDDFLDEMGTVPIDFINSVTLKRIMENQINIMEKSWKYHGILLKKLSNDVGACGLIWDIYDAITSSVCGNFIDSLNVFWFSFYFGGFSTVVLMISSCIIMRYFRKPDSLIDGRRYHNVTHNATNSAGDNQIENVRFEETNNNAIVNKVLPDWSYKVIKRRHKPRRKYCFPASQSPQLLKLRLLSESLQKSHSGSDTNIDKKHGNIIPILERCSELSNLKTGDPEPSNQESVITPEQSDNSNTNDTPVNDNYNFTKRNYTNLNMLNEIDSIIDEIVEVIDETSNGIEAVSSFPVIACIESLNSTNEEHIDDVTSCEKLSDQTLPQQNLENSKEDFEERSIQDSTANKCRMESQQETLAIHKDNQNALENDHSQVVEAEKCLIRHGRDYENELEKIQCALCKHRSLGKLTPQQSNQLENKCTSPDLLPTTTENMAKSLINDLNQRDQFSQERTVNSLCTLSTSALTVNNSASLNDAINEFNFEYNKMSSDLIVSNTFPKSSALQCKAGNASPRVSFLNEGFGRHDKSSNNSKTSLNIQVRPYSQFYECESNPLESKTIRNDAESFPLKDDYDVLELSGTSRVNKNKPNIVAEPYYSNVTLQIADSNSRDESPFKPVMTLSKLATRAFTRHLDENIDDKSLRTDLGHMTATCGHGIEKTTYL